MKKLFTCLLLAAVLLTCASVLAWADDDAIGVEVDGVAVDFADAPPFVDENGRTLVPLRAIANALGMEVEWLPETREAVFTKEYTPESARLSDETSYLALEEVVFAIGSDVAVYTETWLALPTTDAAPEDEDDEEPADGEEAAEGDEEDAEEPAESDEEAPAASAEIVKQESRNIEMDTEAIIVGGSTYAPVRYLAATIGYEVDWDSVRRVVTIDSEDAEDAPEVEAPAEDANDEEPADQDADEDAEEDEDEEEKTDTDDDTEDDDGDEE